MRRSKLIAVVVTGAALLFGAAGVTAAGTGAHASASASVPATWFHG